MARRFHRDMLVVQAIEEHPGAAEVFMRLGYRCIDKDDWCVVMEKDSLAEAAKLHGKPVEELLAALEALPDSGQSADGRRQ